MEEELKCPVCKGLYSNPVLMPCYHSLCLNCALSLQTPAATGQDIAEEVDKLSILSETDSGVVCTSRPNSYVGTPNLQGILFPPLSCSALSLSCPTCTKTVYFDENGAHNLPKYRAMQNIVDKYGESRELAPKCELCTREPAKTATVLCEQCEVHYCDECRENCHPAKGALAKHTLTTPGRAALRTREASRESFCADHQDEQLAFYCMLCKHPVCAYCKETRHASHDVQAINMMCKAQKGSPTKFQVVDPKLASFEFSGAIVDGVVPLLAAAAVASKPIPQILKVQKIELRNCKSLCTGNVLSLWWVSTSCLCLRKLSRKEPFTIAPPYKFRIIAGTCINAGSTGKLRFPLIIREHDRCNVVEKTFDFAVMSVTYQFSPNDFKSGLIAVLPVSSKDPNIISEGVNALLRRIVVCTVVGWVGNSSIVGSRNQLRLPVELVKESVCNIVLCTMAPSVCKKPNVTSGQLGLICGRALYATPCEGFQTELSQNLQQLSEKARSTTEFIQRLKGMSDRIGDNCAEFEDVVIQQCDELINALEARKLQLIEYVRQDRDAKIKALKEQVSACTSKLQHTTAVMQFCIEALKENDSSAFLQVGTMLINRVANEDMVWYQDHNLACPRVSPYCDLTLDHKPLARAVEQLNFIQMKPPNAPVIIPEECSAENNSVTVAWQPPSTSYVEGYVLELDDGSGGEFREVYCGKETICTVDGLHFNSTYNARVKAFNGTGEGDYSELIGLQTSEVAWFTFDPCLSGSELRFSSDNFSVSACEGYEHRVALGSVGFSRGVHYWEFTIDRYCTDTDPSFGIARIDVAKDQMLGKDEKGWGMYIDRQRSWFVHANLHAQRCEGGIQQGSTVGVLLDLNRHQVSFYVNDEPHGPIAFHNLYGVFYPAVSVNRGVTVTLHTALDLPSDIEDS